MKGEVFMNLWLLLHEEKAYLIQCSFSRKKAVLSLHYSMSSTLNWCCKAYKIPINYESSETRLFVISASVWPQVGVHLQALFKCSFLKYSKSIR